MNTSGIIAQYHLAIQYPQYGVLILKMSALSIVDIRDRLINTIELPNLITDPTNIHLIVHHWLPVQVHLFLF